MWDVFGAWIGGGRGSVRMESLVIGTTATSSGWEWLLLCCILKHHRTPSLCLHPGPWLVQRPWSLGESGQGGQWWGNGQLRACPTDEGPQRGQGPRPQLVFHCSIRLHMQNTDSEVKLFRSSRLSTEPETPSASPGEHGSLCDWVGAPCTALGRSRPSPAVDELVLALSWTGLEFSPCEPSSCGLAFSAAWWLGSKNKYPKRAQRKLHCILWSSFGNHREPLLPHCVRGGPSPRPTQVQGRIYRLHLLMGNGRVLQERVGPDVLLELYF